MNQQSWTEKRIKDLHHKKKIMGYHMTPRSKNNSFNNITKQQKRSAEKEWMELNLQYWCNERSVFLLKEHKFDEPNIVFDQVVIKAREWRFDFCIPAFKIAIEYEGIISEKSRHTTINGFTGDANKYNRAQELGWKVLRFTAINYKNLLTTLNQCI